ncbi:MAG: NUDIX domain-containing protein [Saprospiraceae bacterium]
MWEKDKIIKNSTHENKNPWIVKSKKIVYDNAWVQIQHHEVINPSGGDGIYGVVHFKNYAIGIIPIDENGYTWLVGQYRYPLDVYSWELPEGGGPLEDDPLESAKRELREEVGITANKWTKIMDIHTSNSITDELGFVYVAQDLTFGETEHEEVEEIVIRKVHFNELVDMIMNGQITDSITIASVLKLQLLINKGAFTI